MPEYIDKCKKCYHFQVCANVMKNQLFIREKMLLEENPECEHFISAADVVEVVSCKDCEHYEDIGSSHFCNEYGGYVTATDYCSRAENKTNLKKELIND